MKKTVYFLCATPGALQPGSDHALAIGMSCSALRAKQTVPRSVLVADQKLIPAASHAAACLTLRNVSTVDCAKMKCAATVAEEVGVASDISFAIANLLGVQLPLNGPCLVVASRGEIIDIGSALLEISTPPAGYDLAGTIVEGNVYGVQIGLNVAKVALTGFFPSRGRWEGMGKFPLRREVRRPTAIA